MHTHTDSHDLIITGIHMDLTDSLKSTVAEKMERLFRHEERIIRVKVDLECSHHGRSEKEHEFNVKGHIAINGPDLNASVKDSECLRALDLLVDKLDRMLRRRSRLKRVKRKDTHDIEIPASLPKVMEA